MIAKIDHYHTQYSIDTSQPIDLSIPYNFNGQQPNFYDVDIGKLSPLRTGIDTWSVAEGAGCNVPEVSLNIHCSGTHTESVGHLLEDPGDIGAILNDAFIPALLITVHTESFGSSDELYHCDVEANELIVTASAIKECINTYGDLNPQALIIRTLPNTEEKQFHRFNEHIPPFFTNNALIEICSSEFKHLLVDMPSIDRMCDGGILGNHRLFWGDGKHPKGNVQKDSQKTITELTYIPNIVEDGFYFLNIQIPHFVCDAAPSRPLLFKII